MSRNTILFVCTGNTCRSPMAACLFRARAGSHLRWTPGSAGLLATPGRPAAAEAVQVLKEDGLDLAGHRSRLLTAQLARTAGWIVVMARGHLDEIRLRFPEVAERTRLLTSFGTARDPADIQDPIGQSVFVYRSCRDAINTAVSDLVLYLAERGPSNSPGRSVK